MAKLLALLYSYKVEHIFYMKKKTRRDTIKYEIRTDRAGPDSGGGQRPPPLDTNLPLPQISAPRAVARGVAKNF